MAWYEVGAQFTRQVPLSIVAQAPSEFCDFVQSIVDSFVKNVEDQDGWMLLWSEKDRPRAERIVQALFRSTVIHYCRAHDIDLSGEANAGRGPVDFKFSRGWEARALVEVKLTSNTRHWHGLTVQTPQYMKAEEVSCAFFVSVGFRDQDFEEERVIAVRRAAEVVGTQMKGELRVIPVDARRKRSASKA